MELPMLVETDFKNVFLLSEKFERHRHDVFQTILDYTEHVEVLKLKPENRMIYQMNILDKLDPHEPQLSLILRAIFLYKNSKGKNIIFESFAERFLSKYGFHVDLIRNPEIKKEGEEMFMDLLIKEKDYAVVFENKLKGAGFTRNQLAGYIKRLQDMGYNYEDVYIIILPQYYYGGYIKDVPKSVWRLHKGDLKVSKNSRKCAVSSNLCWCDVDGSLCDENKEYCAECENLFPILEQRILVLERDFANWLESVVVDVEGGETLLVSAIYQFVDYLRGLYGKRINNRLLMCVKEFLESELFKNIDTSNGKLLVLNKKIDAIEYLLRGLEDLKRPVCRDLIDNWYEKLKEQWPQLQQEKQKSLGIYVDGMWIGCWFGGDNEGFHYQPYWGFLVESKCITEEQRNKVIEILNQCGFDYGSCKKEEKYGWIAWDNTSNGYEDCQKLFSAAKELGYI